MQIIAPAKLNLFLHVTGRRTDGYHLLESLFVFTDFGDVISIEPAETLSLTIDGPFAATITAEPIEKNLIYRAALLLKNKYAVTQGAHIVLTKQIPIGAGLGGGSSDAAGVLKGLNQLWHLNLSGETLCDIGLSLGADVPACIVGKPAMVSGIGEIIEPIDLPATPLSVLLINPNYPLSTQSVFQAYKKSNVPFTVPSKQRAELTDSESLFNHLTKNKNDLEPAAISLFPEIQVLIETLQQQAGCELARMSGSGSTCFGLFQDITCAKKAEQAMKTLFSSYWIRNVCRISPTSDGIYCKNI